jgi:hypothetical protein
MTKKSPKRPKTGSQFDQVAVLLASLAVFFAILAGVLLVIQYLPESDENPSEDTVLNDINDSITESLDGFRNQEFNAFGLSTDTSQSLIDTELVLSGGVGKDGIPAINNPQFLSVSEAKSEVDASFDGLLVSQENETKFYPFNVLVWHEIVNDTIGGRDVAVTFCPLCGSSLVFDRTVDGETLQFGVSGLLYESNLLMYDTDTETLWSQIEGRAVIGERSGNELELVDTDIISFAELQTSYPDAMVLSQNTGFSRNYNFYPYGDYETNQDEFLFDVTYKGEDIQIASKEIVVATTVGITPVAFSWDDLQQTQTASITTSNGVITATLSNSGVIISDESGNEYPTYYTMWFSWANHNLGQGVNKDAEGQFWFQV